MNILYVVSQYPCLSETFIVREISELKKRGHGVRIFSLKNYSEEFVQRDAEEFRNNVIYSQGILFKIKSFLWVFSNKKRFLSFSSVISKVLLDSLFRPEKLLKNTLVIIRTIEIAYRLRVSNIDHVHAHWANYPSTAAMLLSKLLIKNFSFTCHAHDIYVDDHLMEDKLNDCKFAVTISEYNRTHIEQRYTYDKSKLSVIHCGVDVNTFHVRKKTRITNTILSVGRLDSKKGFDLLIKATDYLVSKGIDIKCEIIGGGELLSKLTSLVAKLGVVRNVEFVGPKDLDYINEKLAGADIFVLPCKEASDKNIDGIPVVLMEAMASGVPVISTSISGIPELVIDGVTGVLSSEGDFLMLASKIEKVLLSDNSIVVDAARSMVENNFNIDTEVTKLEKLMSCKC